MEQNSTLQQAADAQNAAQHLGQGLNSGATQQVNSFVLGRYYRRSEERMNFTSEVLVKAQANGQPIKFRATTVDISGQGLQLKLPASVPVKSLLQQTLSVHFVGLAKDFVIDAKTPYSYQTLGTHSNDQQHYLRLRRQAFAGEDALDKLLRGLLKGYKFRNKVNVDHVVHSVRAKGHESQWLQAQQGLPMVFSADVKKTLYTLRTASNGTAISHWCERQPQLLNGLLSQRWARLAMAKLRTEAQQSRRQLAFYAVEISVNNQLQHYAVPANALSKDTGLRASLAKLQQAGGSVQPKVLSLTYSAQDKLFVGLLNNLDLPQPDRKSDQTAEAPGDNEQLPESLSAYRLQYQQLGATKVVERHPRLVQMYTQSGLCSALFVHKNKQQGSDIGLAALMPVKQGLPTWYQQAELWLNNQYNILGGATVKQQLLDSLAQLKPAQHSTGRTLLLSINQPDDTTQPQVSGCWLNDFASPKQARDYIKQQYQQQQLLAINVELYRCRQAPLQPLKDDLDYVSTHMPERAQMLEQQIKSIQSVIGLQDITGPLVRLLHTPVAF